MAAVLRTRTDTAANPRSMDAPSVPRIQSKLFNTLSTPLTRALPTLRREPFDSSWLRQLYCHTPFSLVAASRHSLVQAASSTTTSATRAQEATPRLVAPPSLSEMQVGSDSVSGSRRGREVGCRVSCLQFTACHREGVGWGAERAREEGRH